MKIGDKEFMRWYRQHSQTEDETIDELKPCPFCGKSGAVYERSDNYAGNVDWHRVRCVYCGASSGDGEKTVAIELWNNRPIEDALRKRIAELEAERLELRKILGWAYDLDEYKDNPEECEE